MRLLASGRVRIPVTLPSRNARQYDAVGLGLNNINLLVLVPGFPVRNTKQRLERFARQRGGQAATAMVTCARLGWRARYIGRFGADDFGAIGRQSLEREGVDTSACRSVPDATNQFAIVIVDRHASERTILWDRHPGLTMFATDVDEAAVRSGRVLLVDCHDTEAATAAARAARLAGVPTVIDVEKVRPGIEELLRHIDIVIAAQEFPERLTGCAELGAALQTIAREWRPALVCATLGAEGSLALMDGRELRTPGFSVPVMDTIGAGDVFRGAFIGGWLEGGSGARFEEVLVFANAVAGMKCRFARRTGRHPPAPGSGPLPGQAAEALTFAGRRGLTG